MTLHEKVESSCRKSCFLKRHRKNTVIDKSYGMQFRPWKNVLMHRWHEKWKSHFLLR